MRQKLYPRVGVKPGLNGVLFPNHKEHGYEGNIYMIFDTKVNDLLRKSC